MLENLAKGASRVKQETQNTIKKAFKSQKNKNVLFLIMLSGIFCFQSIYECDYCEVKAYQCQLPKNRENVFIKANNDKTSFKKDVMESKEAFLSLEKAFAREEKGKKPEKSLFEKELYALLEGHPIKEMTPVIASYDRKVAALAIGIAKKESNWGKRSPSKNGENCYNYWGYKGTGGNGTAMGYACFESAEEAVRIVGDRINYFVNNKKLNTPAKMIIWKCGSSCNWDNPKNVAKWISDVDMYYKQVAYMK